MFCSCKLIFAALQVKPQILTSAYVFTALLCHMDAYVHSLRLPPGFNLKFVMKEQHGYNFYILQM